MKLQARKIILVAGARPNFIKIAPILRVIQEKYQNIIKALLVHTGQHYDYNMSQAFFEDLEIKRPDYFLEVGSASHAVQTARIMVEFEKVCTQEQPQMVVVVGDVNSTAACALVAKKLSIQVAHVEAGLRSRDLTMPEEINRLVTDVLADVFFVTERSALENLRQEGKPESAIFFVGNVMVDTLYYQLHQIKQHPPLLPVTPLREYSVLTLHRPSNVDDAAKLREIMGTLVDIAAELPCYFPVHPRTRGKLEQTGLLAELQGGDIVFLPPLPYKTFLRLWQSASLVFTDSGGLQEETTAMGIPCITLRDTTERPVTITEGSNILGGTTSSTIRAAYKIFKDNKGQRGHVPELWDGRAAERIVTVLAAY